MGRSRFCSDSHGVEVVNSSSSDNEPGANPPSRPTIRPAQRRNSPHGYSVDPHQSDPHQVDPQQTGGPGYDRPLPSRRELRQREAEAAAAQGEPTSVYSDAPPIYQNPHPHRQSNQDPQQNRYPEPDQSTQAMPAAREAHLGAGGHDGQRSLEAPEAGRRRRSGRKQTARREPLGPVRGTIRTFGELCITAGLILILFVVWQLWWTDIEANRDNEVLADELTQDWANQDPNELPDDPDEPIVADPVEKDHAFGIFYIPRFGDDYYRTVAEGVDLEPVLNRMGVGRYPNSAMPGEVGNFSVAGHRVTYGKPFNQIAKLQPGDEIIVQTKDGFYTYTFRNFDIILPDAVEVLSPVPSEPDFKGKDRILTMTACNPMFSARERYVAYAELTDWTPAQDGPPGNIKDSKAYDKVSKNGGA